MFETASFYTHYGSVLSEEDKKLWHAQRVRRVKQAVERGVECYEQGLKEESLFWYGRAERLSGDTSNVMLMYAIVALELGRYAIAASRFLFLQKRFNLREAAFGYVWCLYHQGNCHEAAKGLRLALSKYAAPEGISEVAAFLAYYVGAPGWATLSNNGDMFVRASGRVQISFDDEYLGDALPGRIDLSYWERMKEGVGLWSSCSLITVKFKGQHVLGSPFDITSLTRCDSLVQACRDGIEGWLWYPAEPDFVPRVWINDCQSMDITEISDKSSHGTPLYRPRYFTLPFSSLPGQGKLSIELYDTHKKLLLGAPLDPQLGRILAGYKKALRTFQPMMLDDVPLKLEERVCLKGKCCAVIIPVYRDYRTTRVCITSVLKAIPNDVTIVVINDASPDRQLVRFITQLSEKKRIILRTNSRNQGFTYSVNRGLSLCRGLDVVLLNSDTVVFQGWIERLRGWLCQPDVGTATPLSNEGGLTSYPSVREENALPSFHEARRLDRLCQILGQSNRINMPTGNGFCMAISAACLQITGFMRDRLFAQGYAEENDFCLRATERGFNHVAATNVFVRHTKSVSFQEGGIGLLERNLDILYTLYPHYQQMVTTFEERDVLQETRQKLDWLKLSDGKSFHGAVLLVQHELGGGVARAVRERGENYKKRSVPTLSLTPTQEGCTLAPCDRVEVTPNLRYDLPKELNVLRTHLKELKIQYIEWHHLVGHAPWIRTLHRDLGVPYDVFIHDHVWFCPRISLINGEGHYCGEPSVSGCQACINQWGSAYGEETDVADLLKRSEYELGQARRVVAPSHDAARRLRRHIDVELVDVEPLENDQDLLKTKLLPSYRHTVRRVGILGGISRWKGYDVILELGRYIKENNFPLDIIIIGSTHDDDKLIDNGIKVTGPYKDEDILSLIEEEEIDIGFITSIAPETWCYVLSWLWKANLSVIGFDIGASGERITASGCGQVIPLGVPVDFLAKYLAEY